MTVLNGEDSSYLDCLDAFFLPASEEVSQAGAMGYVFTANSNPKGDSFLGGGDSIVQVSKNRSDVDVFVFALREGFLE